MTSISKSVLFLSYDGLTDPLGQSQILPYMAGLAKMGHRITIISFEKQERFHRDREEIEKSCVSNAISWEPITYHKWPPIISTVFDLYLLRRKVKQLLSNTSFDVVHCRSYLTPFTGVWLKKRTGARFIFDMRGFWADERVEGGLWNLRNPLFRSVYNFFKRKERAFLSAADHVVVLTHEAKQVIHDWGFSTNITVIPCCVDLSVFDPTAVLPETKSRLRSKFGFDPGDFVLLYVGSLGTWYLFDEMLKFFDELKRSFSSTKFLILTPDLDKVPSREDVVAMTVPRMDVAKYASLANASICFIKPSFSKKGSSATKMAELLALEIPVITNAGWGDVAFLEKNLPGVIVVKEGEIFHPQRLAADARRTRVFTETFSLEAGVHHYHRIYTA
jgi:glycosyltransferase involved in cell wall biosynthesis